MAPDYETRSPDAYIAKPSEVKTLLGWSREKLEAYVAKSQPPQAWYDETADPFDADERGIPSPELDAINAKIIANYPAMHAKAVENRAKWSEPAK